MGLNDLRHLLDRIALVKVKEKRVMIAGRDLCVVDRGTCHAVKQHEIDPIRFFELFSRPVICHLTTLVSDESRFHLLVIGMGVSPTVKDVIDDLAEAGVFPLDYIVQLYILHKGIPHPRFGVRDCAEITSLLLCLRLLVVIEKVVVVSCLIEKRRHHPTLWALIAL